MIGGNIFWQPQLGTGRYGAHNKDAPQTGNRVNMRHSVNLANRYFDILTTSPAYKLDRKESNRNKVIVWWKTRRRLRELFAQKTSSARTVGAAGTTAQPARLQDGNAARTRRVVLFGTAGRTA